VTSLYETASELGNLVTWMAAVDIAGLAELLNGEHCFTIFAPTDQAFTKLPRGSVDELLGDRKSLIANLCYHIIPGQLRTEAIPARAILRTVFGDELIADNTDGLRVNQARVLRPNIECRNGLIHTIDEVSLRQRIELPPTKRLIA
jgi:uncharacterized surface protein with fasciclin (FAS1) repeats